VLPILQSAPDGLSFKINAARRDWHDGYHWVLSLTWPQFALCFVGATSLLIFSSQPSMRSVAASPV
jgi:hypothetical protein